MHSLASLMAIGQWRGATYVLTDSPREYASLGPNVHTVAISRGAVLCGGVCSVVCLVQGGIQMDKGMTSRDSWDQACGLRASETKHCCSHARRERKGSAVR